MQVDESCLVTRAMSRQGLLLRPQVRSASGPCFRVTILARQRLSTAHQMGGTIQRQPAKTPRGSMGARARIVPYFATTFTDVDMQPAYQSSASYTARNWYVPFAMPVFSVYLYCQDAAPPLPA